MTQCTTPTFTLTLPQTVDLTGVQNIYFTLVQDNGASLTKTGESVQANVNIVTVYLSQSETTSFEVGEADMQLNWTYSNGARGCTVVKKVTIDKNILRKVVE